MTGSGSGEVKFGSMLRNDCNNSSIMQINRASINSNFPPKKGSSGGGTLNRDSTLSRASNPTSPRVAGVQLSTLLQDEKEDEDETNPFGIKSAPTFAEH